jgi:hypothetical protein
MQAVDETGKLRKSYPTKSHQLKLTNSAKAATYEMMIRVSDIKGAGIKFDENFGAGATNYLGDEYIFIADALRSGLKGQFEPIVIATHPTESSGSLRNSTTDRRARAKIFSRVFGIWAPVMRGLFLAKPPSKKFGFMEWAVKEKFKDETLKEMLLMTENKKIIEGNYWHDNFWGQCTCEKCFGKGKNKLGKILMDIRSELDGTKKPNLFDVLFKDKKA